MKSSSNKSLTTGLLVSLTAVGLVAWFGGGVAENFRGDAKVDVGSSVPEKAGKEGPCAAVECPSLTCGEGERPSRRPGECCARCTSTEMAAKTPQDCSSIQCEGCPPDTQPEQVKGACCPVCRPLSNAACDEGRAEYDQKVAGLETELRACSSDEDCIVASYSDSCRYVCPSPVNKLALGKVVERLRAIGSEHCGSCSEMPSSCAAQVDQSVVCRAGACAFAHAAAH